MDAQTAEKINELAKRMKELHIEANMEDAYKKAEEIILGAQTREVPPTLFADTSSAEASEEKSIKELMKEHGQKKKERD